MFAYASISDNIRKKPIKNLFGNYYGANFCFIKSIFELTIYLPLCLPKNFTKISDYIEFNLGRKSKDIYLCKIHIKSESDLNNISREYCSMIQLISSIESNNPQNNIVHFRDCLIDLANSTK